MNGFPRLEPGDKTSLRPQEISSHDVISPPSAPGGVHLALSHPDCPGSAEVLPLSTSILVSYSSLTSPGSSRLPRHSSLCPQRAPPIPHRRGRATRARSGAILAELATNPAFLHYSSAKTLQPGVPCTSPEEVWELRQQLGTSFE